VELGDVVGREVVSGGEVLAGREVVAGSGVLALPDGPAGAVGAARTLWVVRLVPTTAPTATRRASSTLAAAIIRRGVTRTRAG
jgi:hypothetical protein